MPKPRLRERILTYGGPGSGKTNAWMRLAKHLPDSTFYVIDTEIGAERSLQEYPEIENVVVYPVIDWTDYRKAQKEIILKATAINNVRDGIAINKIFDRSRQVLFG